MKVDLSKKYKTRSGKEVVLFSDRGDEPDPILGAIVTQKGTHSTREWGRDGRYLPPRENENDLIEVKPRIKGWIPIYLSDGAFTSGTLRELDLPTDEYRKSIGAVAIVSVDIDQEEV